jgi:iron complex outermembrane recepter protein
MKARHQGWRRFWVWLAALAAGSTCIASPAAAAADSSKPVYFEIAEGPAQTQLTEFSKQSELQMVFDYDAVSGVTTQGVRGNYKPLDALKLMVKGTDITYELLERRTVTIKRNRAQRNASKPAVPTTQPLYRRQTDRRTPDATLEEVNIRALRPTTSLPATGSPYYALNRTDIDAGGYVTVQSVINTLPQIFGGGPTEDTEQIGFEASTNTARGSGVNLRGLGASATLVLMNGRRLPGSGSEGLFVDVSNLPLAAVERMDILPDNSSTFYGSDAVGGVVNFVMRDDFDGALTEAFYGAATQGQLNQNYVSQVFGTRGETRKGLLAFDFYARDNLPASSRSQAKSDLTSFGGSNFDVPQSTRGNILLGPLTWAIPTRADGQPPERSDFQPGTVNLQNRYEGVDILPSQQRWTIFGTGEQKLSDEFTVYVDALYGQRDVRRLGGGVRTNLLVPSTNAYYVNPTPVPGTVTVAYDFLRDLGPLDSDIAVETKDVAAVLDWKPSSTWTITGTLAFAGERTNFELRNSLDLAAVQAALADSNPATALNVFGGPPTNPATLAAVRAESIFKADSSVRTASLVGSGPVTTLPGGPAVLSVGGEQRNHSFESLIRQTATGPVQATDLDRKVWAAFAELQLPLFSEENAMWGLQKLELSLAERFESYDDFGDTENTRLGLSWQPAAGLTLRGTYSESFRPPGLADLDEATNAYQYVPLASTPGGAPVMNLFWIGKNRDLQEERAHSWTAGFGLTSLQNPGTALAVTYFNIEFRNRLSRPEFNPNFLTDPALAPLVTLNPSAAYREEVCRRAPKGAQPFGCLTVPVAAVVDLRLRNDASFQTSGFDLLASYERASKLGLLTFGLNGTYILDFSEVKASYVPAVDRVSTPNYPINLRLRASAQLQRGPLDIATFVDYRNSYLDTTSTPRRHVSSWTTLDLQASYRFGKSAPSAPGETTLSLGVDNIFDAPPPFLNNPLGIGYDQENGDLTGRLISISLRKKW